MFLTTAAAAPRSTCVSSPAAAGRAPAGGLGWGAQLGRGGGAARPWPRVAAAGGGAGAALAG